VQAVQFGAPAQPGAGGNAGQTGAMGSGGASSTAPVAPSGGAGMDMAPGGGMGMQTVNPASTGTGGMDGAPSTSTGTGGMGDMPSMSTGTGGMDGASSMSTGTGGMGAETSGPKPTRLTATITTKTMGGKYAPKNVGAIWIEDSSGKWVYTLDWWDGLLNVQWLTHYNSVQGPSYTFFDPKPGPDVITSPTLNMHKTHEVSWGFEDKNGAQVPDGDYKLKIEITEESATGTVEEIPFTKGPEPVTLMPPDKPCCVGMKLTLE
jgi:hypothetical protein